ncbi:hypothetical protein DRE_04847 [Drechslerella stenobrocha 248]|uniref:Uncharacterized protein n=1 Tax=Drechslerella stenobrocha 248 TaxID=1043628 RepID=W7I9V8_9PEZI|nr:hypothetical protein DRE_04847 [Drechslerella stenobrocha 248]
MAYRRGNISQLQANLNIINPMYGAAEPIEDAFDQSNLDLFANASFFDWDMGQTIHTAIDPKAEGATDKKADLSSMDVFGGDAGLDSKPAGHDILSPVSNSAWAF